MALQVGQLFGNYRVVRLIGEGGFGEVYLAENPLIDRRVAVKVLHAALAQDEELVRRFLNEARAVSAIRHPNIVEVLDAGGTPEGAPYILMEFLEGVSLQKRLADVRRLALAQVLDIASQAGSALAAAHAAGIVHRDLKPENLFLVPDADAPSGERVKVLDFGIAKISHGSKTGGTVRTQSGLIMGSPAYMSPEQCKDSADVDLRSDIYSFATILYEMLAGRTPHVAPSGTELLIMHLIETPRPLRELAAEVPAHVEAVIMRALARTREDRFDSISAFLGALRGEAGASTANLGANLGQPSSPAIPPTRAARPAPRTERIVPVQPNTTFSRSTGDVLAEASDERPSSHRGRRIAFTGIGVFVLCAAAVGVSLKLRARPGGNGHGMETEPAMLLRPVTAPTEHVPKPLPTTSNPAAPQGPDDSAVGAVVKGEEPTAVKTDELVVKHSTVGESARTKKTPKGRTKAHAAAGDARASVPKPPPIALPPTVSPQPASPATTPAIIKHKKF